jgi:predicted Zn-dependent protease
VEHGERALELAPEQPAVMDTVAWILLDRGQIERAADLLQKAHQAAPDSAQITFHYVVALHRSGEDAAAKQLLQLLLKDDASFAERPKAEALFDKLTATSVP